MGSETRGEIGIKIARARWGRTMPRGNGGIRANGSGNEIAWFWAWKSSTKVNAMGKGKDSNQASPILPREPHITGPWALEIGIDPDKVESLSIYCFHWFDFGT